MTGICQLSAVIPIPGNNRCFPFEQVFVAPASSHNEKLSSNSESGSCIARATADFRFAIVQEYENDCGKECDTANKSVRVSNRARIGRER